MLSGENFVQQGLISQDQLELAAQKQAELGGNEPIARLLVSLGFISERDRVKAMGEVWNIPFVELADAEPDPAATGLLSAQLAKRFRALPLRLEEGKLVVAMLNPLDVFVIDEIRMTTGKEVEPAIAVEEDLNAAYAAFYKQDIDLGDTLQGVMSDFDGDLEVRSDDDDEDLSEDQLREMGEDAPIIRLANLIINQAVNDKASDIHIEPRKDGLVVRYRIDGMMLEAMTLPRKVIAPLTSRFKIVANMDIAEKRAPQDNRISAVINGREFDFRVSTLPVVYGEKIVMRVLDKGSINVGLEKLGFLEHNLETIRDFTQKSYGIILVTGPTGSGKSTTLYSILNAMNDGERNIITIEDPVEYELSGINQCNVNVKANMTFAAGLRAML
ncbi:MAG: GspE/PulE family protein, partial [Fimbriimonadaceae bacterium]